MAWLAVLTVVAVLGAGPCQGIIHRQHVHPGCTRTTGEDPACNLTSLLLRQGLNPATLGATRIPTQRLLDCLKNRSRIILPAIVVDLTISFSHHFAFNNGDCGAGMCSCDVELTGPNGSYFQISRLAGAQTRLEMEIKDGAVTVDFDEQKTVTTRCSRLEVEIENKKALTGTESFKLYFQALPNCQRQLQVKCDSAVSVSLCSVTVLCQCVVSVCRISALYQCVVSLCCVIVLCHCDVSLCCVTVLCHCAVSLGCVTVMCHWAVSLCCVTVLCHCAVSLCCVTVLCHCAVSLCCVTVLCPGLVETPGWAEGKRYLNSMDSCVTLHVPPDHVTMVSLVSMDVQMARNNMDCTDSLALYRGANCTGSRQDEGRVICRAQDLAPTLLTTDALSLRFTSNQRVVRTGFRVLYTFHEQSEEPVRLPGGKWNCSVPFYSSFQRHFTCIAQSFCADGRDKVSCPKEEEDLCGPTLVTFGGSCYRLFQPLEATSWTKASQTCSNYGGGLAVLNTPSTLARAAHFITDTAVNKHVFVGLRIASSTTLSEMYQGTWLWSDKTLAVFSPIVFQEVDAPYCAALKDREVTMVTCDRTMDAAFLCETDFTPDHAANDTLIALTPQSAWRTDHVATCRHNHTAHTFLACDVSTNCSALSPDVVLACSHEFSPPVPFFTCRNQLEHVPYTLVCDFRSDCCDGSDEDFCHFPACDSKTEYECADGKQVILFYQCAIGKQVVLFYQCATGKQVILFYQCAVGKQVILFYQCAVGKQCISHDLKCDKRSDCMDGSDEFKCRDSLTQDEVRPRNVTPPASVDFTGTGSFRVTPLNHTACPPTHFGCPGGGYCLPVYVRCNGVNDCPGKEDEMSCDHYTCPGFYRCRHSPICVHRQHLCDGVFQCPQHDDEWLCNVTCPDTCHCYGHAFICRGFFTPDAYPELRYVDASGTGMKPEHFRNNTKLIHLNMRKCEVTSLESLNFPNLQILDLTDNSIQVLDSHIFQLNNLVSLSLAYNPLYDFNAFLHDDSQLSNLIKVNFSGVKLPTWNSTLFNKFPHVQYLDMSRGALSELTEAGFQNLKFLRVLNLQGCSIIKIFPGVFDGLNQLEEVRTDNFKLCCPSVVPEGMDSNNCKAPMNEISSCDALLRADVFRVFLAFYAILALIGNAGSFIYRVCLEGSAVKLGYEVFVTHLSVADFLMGVYLSIIGIADRVYLGDYQWKDSVWTHSVACKTAGFLSLVSSEVSAFLISLITLERLLVIGFPHKSLRFNRLSAHAASLAVWLVGLLLALVPLLPVTSHWEFYSQSGICIPLPITRTEFAGMDYAFGVMIIMNFILFLFIAFGQLLIYWFIRNNTVSCNDSGRKSRDTAIARRLLAVVMTDFLCWFPIGVLGMMARSGVPVSGEINVAIAIFVLPFNSALNPFLYTLNVVMERRRKIVKVKKSQHGGGMAHSQNTTRVFDVVSESRKAEVAYSRQEALQLFTQFLEAGLLTPAQVRRQSWRFLTAQASVTVPYDLRGQGTRGDPYDLRGQGTRGDPYDLTGQGTRGDPYDLRDQGKRGDPYDLRGQGTRCDPYDLRGQGTRGDPYDLRGQGTRGDSYDLRGQGTRGDPYDLVVRGRGVTPTTSGSGDEG
ncbi:hypothetical protein ACOMHN_051576 [Nucella lapillus]